MKKLLLFVPAVLLAATGLFWIGSGYTTVSGETKTVVQTLPHDPRALFGLSEHSMRQIIRHGDEESLSVLKASLASLDTALAKLNEKGFSISTTKHLVAQYEYDSLKLTQAAAIHMKKLNTYDTFEHTQKKAFEQSLEQIGLYELQKTFEDLERTRLTYIKTPSTQVQQKYEKDLYTIKQTIRELYLDEASEKRLFAYLDNHNYYFQTIASIYTSAGIESIYRLTTNSYAIKADLQLLPNI